MLIEQKLDEVTAELLSLHPLYFRKFLYGEEISAMEVARFKILGIAEITGPLPISEIGKRLFVSRPYMTRLIDGLIAEGLIERHVDEKDRRVINIHITNAGKEYFRGAQAHLRFRMRQILSTLDEDDITELSEALSKMKKILRKLA